MGNIMSPREQFMVAAMQSPPLLGRLTEGESQQNMKMDRQPMRIHSDVRKFNDFAEICPMELFETAIPKAFAKPKYPEFDPYVSGARMFLPMIHWTDPNDNHDMFTSPDKIPINVMSMKYRQALANGTVMFSWIPRQNMKW